MNAQFCLLYVVGVFVIKLQRKWAQHARIEDFFAVCSIVLWSGARAAPLEFLWTTMSILWFQRLHYFSLPNKFWILENKHPIFISILRKTCRLILWSIFFCQSDFSSSFNQKCDRKFCAKLYLTNRLIDQLKKKNILNKLYLDYFFISLRPW